MTNELRRVFIVASEPSGDLLGAELIDEIRGRTNSIVFSGIGGRAMSERGVMSDVDTSGLQTVGILDGLMAMTHATKVAKAAAEDAVKHDPAMAILIDSWGFSLRVAMAMRARMPELKIVKYVGPQVWASRSSRAKQLAQWVDHLLCIFPFETQYYEPHGLACTVVGYPPISRAQPGDGAGFRKRHGIDTDTPVVLALFGSRPKEVTRTAPVFEAALAQIQRAHPNVKIVSIVSSGVAEMIAERRSDWKFDALILPEDGAKVDAFAAADIALAVSGTVTTEVALQGAPVVVGYITDWLTWSIARSGFLTTKYITLLNVMADAEIAPEFVQTRCRPGLVAQAITELLDDPERRAKQIAAQNRALDQMGRGHAAPTAIAADTVLDLLDLTA